MCDVVSVFNFMCANRSFLLLPSCLWPHTAGRSLSGVRCLLPKAPPLPCTLTWMSSRPGRSHFIPHGSCLGLFSQPNSNGAQAAFPHHSGAHTALPSSLRPARPLHRPDLGPQLKCAPFSVLWVSVCTSLRFLPFQTENLFITQIIYAY